MSGPDAVHRIEDPFAFARSGSFLSGQLAVADMPRLWDRMTDKAATIAYGVRGRVDQRQRPLLELEIGGTARMPCDRCLDQLEFPLKLASRVLLVQPGTVRPEDADDPEAPEWLEVAQALDLQELVEDEILLGLPYSVRHGDGECSDQIGSSRAGGKASPFSALASLIEPKQTNKD